MVTSEDLWSHREKGVSVRAKVQRTGFSEFRLIPRVELYVSRFLLFWLAKVGELETWSS